MRKLLAFLLLSSVVLSLPSAAQAQKGKKDLGPVPETAAAADYKSLNDSYKDLGSLTSPVVTIMGINASGKVLTLRVEFDVAEPIAPKNTGVKNPGAMDPVFKEQLRQNKEWQALQTEYQKIMNMPTKNPQQQNLQNQKIQQFMTKIQNAKMRDYFSQMQAQAKNGAKAPNFKTVKVAKEFELEYIEEVRVAKLKLPVEYGEKGELKTYEKEELKKMKDEKLNGFKAKFEDVSVGQKVYLTFKKRPAPKKESTTKKDTDKKPVDKKDADPKDDAPKKDAVDKKDDEPRAGPMSDNTGPFVTGILILEETTLVGGFNPPPEKKKKKNN